MTIAISVTSVLAILFFCLYWDLRHDCKLLQKDNNWLREQQGRLPEKESEARPLDKGTAKEAIRFNGFVPWVEDSLIKFRCQGELYIIDAERFPVLVMLKQYNIDPQEWDMDLMHKAAHQVSDELILVKVLFYGEEDESLVFQITAIENKYGHFNDSLTRYIDLIEKACGYLKEVYDDMDSKQKNEESTNEIPIVPGLPSEKKILS
ncbi:MAG: hypothetical protein IJ151_07155 [Bacteroidales bacterium]|nr:hypothetical protein [Bacteroidales bacterium]